MRSFLLAGTQSGCGKTSVTLALLQYLKHEKNEVACFKAGPDFLDPLWHQAIKGKVSLNLDTRMIGEAESRTLFTQSTSASYALVEGVMGMFDGRSGVGESGSSAHLAKTLAIPVVLIVDAKGMAGSIVPLVSGFVQQADKMGVTISAVIANRVGSEHHASLLKDFLTDFDLPPLVAWMSKQAPILPERHLGLVRPDESEIPDFLPALHVEKEVLASVWGDVDSASPSENSASDRLKGQKIAIAYDDASCFCYQENMNWLESEGAEIVFFSPLAGELIADDVTALWLPGGYPELYAESLSNSKSLESIQQFVEQGKPVLAECGGLMLLGASLQDKAGTVWPMANILPFTTRMQDKLASLGYREDASGVRGHEFHHSVRENMTDDMEVAFSLERGDKGIQYNGLRASYVHWYFASAPEVVATWFNGEINENA